MDPQSVIDARDLAALGHAQALSRKFDIWSMLALAFCVLGTWSTFAQDLASGLTNGGPVCILWGLCLVTACNLWRGRVAGRAVQQHAHRPRPGLLGVSSLALLARGRPLRLVSLRLDQHLRLVDSHRFADRLHDQLPARHEGHVRLLLGQRQPRLAAVSSSTSASPCSSPSSTWSPVAARRSSPSSTTLSACGSPACSSSSRSPCSSPSPSVRPRRNPPCPSNPRPSSSGPGSTRPAGATASPGSSAWCRPPTG
ncbi:hypothetical protein VTN96DRAFT_5880 [Rasamsonia emersonii]